MRVVASEQHRRRATIAETREAVLEAAQRVADGIAGPDTLRLVARLEKVTGAGIEELGQLATHWLDG
jgi:hypothetical protein